MPMKPDTVNLIASCSALLIALWLIVLIVEG